jgi:hypothetical protein
MSRHIGAILNWISMKKSAAALMCGVGFKNEGGPLGRLGFSELFSEHRLTTEFLRLKSSPFNSSGI